MFRIERYLRRRKSWRLIPQRHACLTYETRCSRPPSQWHRTPPRASIDGFGPFGTRAYRWIVVQGRGLGFRCTNVPSRARKNSVPHRHGVGRPPPEFANGRVDSTPEPTSPPLPHVPPSNTALGRAVRHLEHHVPFYLFVRVEDETAPNWYEADVIEVWIVGICGSGPVNHLYRFHPFIDVPQPQLRRVPVHHEAHRAGRSIDYRDLHHGDIVTGIDGLDRPNVLIAGSVQALVVDRVLNHWPLRPHPERPPLDVKLVD